MEICYFSNFKAKSNLRKCTDSPEPSLIAEMRNTLFLDFLSSVEFATRVASQWRDAAVSGVLYPACFFVFWNK